VELISMHLEEDWLFRPVLRGMFHADRLLDGSVDLEFIALCNEAIDVEIENTARQMKK
jgi:hypothetical protein